LTKETPKTLLKIKGDKSILRTQVESFNKIGILDIFVVRGFAKDKITETNIKTIDNDKYNNTKELYSLYLARDKIIKNTVISYGDIIFKEYILNELLNDNNDITIIVDSDAKFDQRDVDYVQADIPYSDRVYSTPVSFMKMLNKMDKKDITGEFIGLWKVSENGSKQVHDSLEKLSSRSDFKELTLIDLFNDIASNNKISVKYIRGSWLGIETIIDLQKSGDF